MKYIKIFLVIFVVASIGYLVVKEYAEPFLNNETDGTALKTESIPDGVVMYYFHGNRRCPTCRAIERYSHETARQYLNDHKLIWEIVNVEDLENKHFVYDFSLSSSGPVLVEYKDKKVERYQSLDKVWQLVREREDFMKYVDDEIRRFIQ